MADKETAYVYPEESASAMEWFTLADAPQLGTWYPGRPKTLTELGLTAAEAADVVKANSLPLKRTSDKPPKDPAPSGASAPSGPQPSVEGEQTRSPMPGMSAEEFQAGVDAGDPVLVALDKPGAKAPSGEPAPPPKPQTFGDVPVEPETKG